MYWRNSHYRQTQIVDKNRLQCNKFSKSVQFFLVKIANSWVQGPPEFTQFLAIFDIFWQYYVVKMRLIDFGRLNLLIEEKICKKIRIRISCCCRAQIEAG